MKCAVVGNSSILLNKEYGKEIDKYDIVIRFNTAKTKNFEKHVGSKTDIRFSNLHLIMCVLDEQHHKEHTQYFPDWDNNFIYTLKNENIYLKNINFFNRNFDLYQILEKNNNKINHVEKELLLECTAISNGDPTMGLIGVQYAIKNFDHVDCYGFSFYKEQNFHYFEKTIPYEIPHKKYFEEFHIKSLEECGKIKIYE